MARTRPPQSRPPATSADPAERYARDVLAGRIVAGPHVRHACRRHLEDLAHGAARGLVWDQAAADRAYGYFAEVLLLNGGQFEGQPFILGGWQTFIVGNLFGWKLSSGVRRFVTCYVEGAKGCGKSPLAAGIGLYLLTSDGEPRAEVYAAAAKKDQAQVLFRDAVAMVDQSPELRARIRKFGGSAPWNLVYERTASFFRPIASDGGGHSGPRPHGALVDEVHEHDDGGHVINMLRQGFKFRRQPLLFLITNSGAQRIGVCWEYHRYAVRVAEGSVKDDRFFGFVCALDDGDEPFEDESCWVKANPNIGHVVPYEVVRQQVVEARGMPSVEATVRRLQFCQWTDAVGAWISGDRWRAVEVDELPERQGRPRAYAAIDLSGKRDLSALAVAIEAGDGLDLETEFWLPKDLVAEKIKGDRAPYDVWEREGFIVATPGSSIDFGYIAKRLGEIQARYELQWVGFDPYRIDDLKRELDDQGLTDLPLVAHPQGFRRTQGKDGEPSLWMPASIEEFERRIGDQTIRIKRNPVLTWCAANAVLRSDEQNNRKFDKRKSTGRIDGVVAGAMAVGLAASADCRGSIDDFLFNPVHT